jgi:hypothetical protein
MDGWISRKSAEQAGLWRRLAYGQTDRFCCRDFLIQVIQYLLDDHKVFDAGDQFGRTTTGTARLNVDIKHAPQPLHLGHRNPARFMADLS